MATPQKTIQNQIPSLTSRRKFLASSIVTIPIISIAGPFAFSHNKKRSSEYTPQFFSQEEWHFIEAAVDQLIPEDNLGAGAKVAGVAEFIDQQMLTPYAKGELWYMHAPFYPDADPDLGYQHPYVPFEVYRLGIKDINQYCVTQFQKVFANLSADLQISLLQQMEADELPLPTIPSNVFFEQLLANTKEGFFADPMYGGNKALVGWKLLNFPGARADFMDWIDEPNKPYPYPPVSINGKRG